MLAQGEDLVALQRRLAGQVRDAIAGAGAGSGLEQRGLTEWPAEPIPRVVELEVGGRTVKGYPALVDEGSTVAVQLLDTADAQHQAMWAGIRRLLWRRIPLSRKAVQHRLTNDVRLMLSHSPYPTVADLVDDCVMATLDEQMARAGAPVWDAEGFDALVGQVADGLEARVTDTVLVAARVLAANLEVDRQLAAVSGPGAGAAAADVAAQRDAPVYDGFVAGVGPDRLADVARYLEAMALRLQKRRDAPVRDDQLMASVHDVQRRYDELFDRLGPEAADRPEVLDIAWMIEELRVSLFAQSLGTPAPVSPKRVLDAIAALG